MRKKLFFTYVIIILFLAVLLGFYSIEMCKKYYTEEYEEHLTREVEMLAYILENQYLYGGEAELLTNIEEYEKKLETRITLINQEGVVLYDSEAEQGMDNHRDREEVILAFQGEIGHSTRYSYTTKLYTIYAAAPVYTNDGTFVLRAAVPLRALNTMKNQVVIYIFAGIIMSVLLAFLCAYVFAGKIVAPLNALTDAAEELAKGNFLQEMPAGGGDQIGQLTEAFNQMSRQLAFTIGELENENSKLESIVNSMINGVVAVDNEKRILMMNPVCYQLFQIDMKEVSGYFFEDIIHDKTICEILERAQKDKTGISKEFSFSVGLEGSKILRVFANPIAKQQEKDTIMGALLVFQDVTQIRKLEQLRNEFVSNVTHELKTPLTSILGFTDTLKCGAINDREAALRFIDIIDIEAKRLYRLIQDILSLSEIETRERDINVSRCNILQILEKVMEMLTSAASEKGLLLKLEVQKPIPLFLCNSDRITQMLINLIENAVKYTEMGSVIVYCSAEQGFLKFIVKDSGIGIPKESQSRIFERFYRVDKGRSRKAGGTGLGLSIVKHIVFLYDGKIEVDSEEGKGSTFTILLPYRVG